MDEVDEFFPPTLWNLYGFTIDNHPPVLFLLWYIVLAVDQLQETYSKLMSSGSNPDGTEADGTESTAAATTESTAAAAAESTVEVAPNEDEEGSERRGSERRGSERSTGSGRRHSTRYENVHRMSE